MRRWSGPILRHLYVWVAMGLFTLPFLTLLRYSLRKGANINFTVSNYEYVFGSFKGNLLLSFQATGLTIAFNLLLAVPAAYALVRYALPAKRLLLTGLTLALYTPAAVLGIGLVLTYNFALRPLAGSLAGLVAAYVVGTYPLMLLPVTVALKDLDPAYEEAALCLGAGRLRTFFRVVLPLIGQGILAGVLLTFVIVFNEYLVTVFVAGPGLTTAPLRVFNLVRTAGIQNTTAALAATMQIVSFVAVIAFLRTLGARYLRGTFF